MNRIFIISDGRGERRLGEADLPLRIGGKGAAELEVPGMQEDTVAALIALSEGHIYVQPVAGSERLFHNHELLLDSAWLKSGDRLEAGTGVLTWTVKGDQVLIGVQPREVVAASVPPPMAPPVASRPVPDTGTAEATRAPGSRWLRNAVIAVFALLVLTAGFLALAVPVSITLEPGDADWSLNGFPPPISLWERRLAIPGAYRLEAKKAGFVPLSESLVISRDGPRGFTFALVEKPGRVSVRTSPAVPVRLFVDDAPAAPGPDGTISVPRGPHQLRVESERYLPLRQAIEVAGLGQAQELEVMLQPGWAEVFIDSVPPGASVRVAGEEVGATPLTVDIMAGRPTITLSLPAHKPVSLNPEIQAGAAQEWSGIVLPPADASLDLRSKPPGSSVTLNSEYVGITPLSLALAPNRVHSLRLSKPGYQVVERTVNLGVEEERRLDLNLPAEFGVVFLSSDPADATLRVDGREMGSATQRLRLTSRPHTLEISKAGFQTRQVSVTPRPDVAQNLEISLLGRTRASSGATAPALQAADGQRLILIRPGQPFQMGASRREPGRRANESRRQVRLTRAFYLGEMEVSNQSFRQFRAGHDSGSLDGAGLNGDRQPVVNVSWEDAARYCNWLSDRDGLPPAYQEQQGTLQLKQPLTTGYRLPTEAEWAYAARFLGRSQPARYPWGDGFPPKAGAGNYADARIADTLAEVVPNYDDGYRGTAPVDSFSAGPGGFFNLGGNVAEWANDKYTVYTGSADRQVTDPIGPAQGQHHLVRGSSWRHGNITELRLSYRDYSKRPRADVGFRIARFVDQGASE